MGSGSLPTRRQGSSVALGANDPRTRRNDAGELAASDALRRRVQSLRELDASAPPETITERVNEMIRLMKEAL